MALYKYSACIRQTDIPAFDVICLPKTAAPWPGIYQCTFCGHEIAIAQNQLLPPQNHHQHLSETPIEWRLVVSTRDGKDA